MPNYLTCFSRQAAQRQGQLPGASQGCLSVHLLRTSAGKPWANYSIQYFLDQYFVLLFYDVRKGLRLVFLSIGYVVLVPFVKNIPFLIQLKVSILRPQM